MSEESSTGVKLLSANPRALVALNVPNATVIAPGLSTTSLQVPVMIDQPYRGIAGNWPILRNRRMKFSGSTIINSAGASEVSLESAALSLFVFTPTQTLQLVNAARLSNLSALAQNAPVSFDEWLIDHNDLLALSLQAGTYFQLFIYLTLNNTGAAPKGLNTPSYIQCDAAQFDNYRFSKWE